MKFRYQDLRVGHDILNLIDLVYELTKQFPAEEKFDLLRQMRRAATSIYLNIAEGTAKKSAKDFARFITIAQGSLVEVHACLTIAQRRNYVDAPTAETADKMIEVIWIQLSALHNSQVPPP